MKQFVGALLAAVMLVCSLPMAAFAIEYDDFENIAKKEYTEDEVVYASTYESNSVSSTGKDRWNSFYPSVYMDAIADPEDSTNKVGRFFSAGSSRNATLAATKNYLFAKEGKDFILSTDLYIPLCVDEQNYPVTISVKVSSTVALTLNYNSQSGLYDWTFGGTESGTVAPQSWFHFSVHATPSQTAGFAQSTMDVQISGSTVKDKTGASVSAVKESGLALSFNNTADKGGSLQIATTVPEIGGTKIAGGYYIDNTRFFIPGAFRITDVSADTYGDPAENVNLNGNVTVKFNHDMDLSTLDLSKVRLVCGTDDSDVPYTSLTVDPARPSTVTFSFAEDTLQTYTDYYIYFEDTLSDVSGEQVYEPSASFTTKGTQNSRPAPEPIIEEPAGGYVMPDKYNTGYRCDESELVPFNEKYPLFTSTAVEITEKLAKEYNYEFSHFTLTGSIIVTATSPVYIHDFYLFSDTHGGISNSGSARLTVAWGECENSLSAMFGGNNLTLSHIYCHDVKADHMKG
ncbi:MAG: Ig-like domain-containing protein, partial [Clostridia bacterium]|nr:Ig-like domain-containing protein [Clostridia bacterium]